MYQHIVPLFAAGSAPAFFSEIAALIVCGALIAYVCNRLGIVPIVGFLVAGVVIGPNATGIVSDRELVDAAAELGVILLLFTIGIEFSLKKLARIKRLIFVGGGLQVGVTTLATIGSLIFLGISWQASVFTGFLVALSSTVIVLKLLADRDEMREQHAQVGLGLLIFQDLAVVLMVLLVPMLGGDGGTLLSVTWALSKAAILIGGVLIVARSIMPKILEAVARTCSPELFLLTVIGICFGTAYLTSLAGVSLSLGAFLAGLVVSESRYSEHAMSEILPLQILFSATFFISVGMLLDIGFMVNNLPLVLGVLAVVVLIKLVVTGVSVRLLGYSLPVAITSAFVLAQIGEFSFVLERAGREYGLFPAGMERTGSQTFIAATVLGMLLTPVLATVGVRVGAVVRRREHAVEARSNEEILKAHPEGHSTEGGGHAPPRLSDHVVVAGYGEAGRSLVRALRAVHLPFVITTLRPEGANEAEEDGMPVLRGDARKARTLRLAGLEAARLLVIPDDNPSTARHIAMVARTVNERIPIIVRTRLRSDIASLHEDGVTLVIAEEMEGTVQLFAESLHYMNVPPASIEAMVHDIRVSDYASLIGETGAVGSSEVATTVQRELVELDTNATEADCTHIGRIRPVLPSADGCEKCRKTGDRWVHLRICMICGHVGCCDSSKNKHASAHFRDTGHEIMRSFEPNEDWGWCFVDRAQL